MTTINNPVLTVFPPSAAVNRKGHLSIGGCDTVALAEEYGTPLYVFDEAGIRARCREFTEEFGQRYPAVQPLYACKAFTNLAMLRLIEEEGLGLDVVSGGEIAYAEAAGFPMEYISFAGNNKSAEELELAIEAGVGHIVVDNLPELNLLQDVAGGRRVHILLRLSPGVDPHAHDFNTTGTLDSKFGLTRATWDDAMRTAMASPNLYLLGFHFHIGSGIYETAPYEQALDIVLDYAADIKQRFQFEMQVLSAGGGYAALYDPAQEPPTIATYAEALTGRLQSRCDALGLEPPHLIIEPGRSIVAQYGVALYTTGTIKDIPGVRTYASVNGGMGDNIRYPLYGFVQQALLANRPNETGTHDYRITGKYCESGDILIPDIRLPELKAGDILAVAGSGAYAVPMASNYNANYRPAIVFVNEGKARLVRRRETIDDLTGRDID